MPHSKANYMLMARHCSRSWITARGLQTKVRAPFKIPASYRANHQSIDNLPFGTRLTWWWNSLRPSRLQELQDALLKLMLPADDPANARVKWQNKKVHVKMGKDEEEANWINEVSMEVTHDSTKPVKHVVFIHGYGASLGCFARNFQLVTQLHDMHHNYKIHFLDNISFGLSSNPNLLQLNSISKCAEIHMNDPDETDSRKLYNKYYKLIDSYSVDVKEFEEYRAHFTPIVKDLETYYTSAIDAWRERSGIEKIDYLIGHSYGGYWSGSYAVRYPSRLNNLILLSPVGVERHVHAITNPLDKGQDDLDRSGAKLFKPSLDPKSFQFLSRLPILSKRHTFDWYHVQPRLHSLLKWMGPFGVARYYKMWYSKLFKINKLIAKHGGAQKLFVSGNDMVYGTNQEIHLIIEYLYNSVSKGSVSDIYIKNILTPATVSKWPLYDKFTEFYKGGRKPLFGVHMFYGQFDFMNAEAGKSLVQQIKDITEDADAAEFGTVAESGHNLYIDNPFEVNQRLQEIFARDDAIKLP